MLRKPLDLGGDEPWCASAQSQAIAVAQDSGMCPVQKNGLLYLAASIGLGDCPPVKDSGTSADGQDTG